jgi:hypothetical protein
MTLKPTTEPKPCEVEGCERIATRYIHDAWLCDECADAYDNKTGYCSLYCCVTGNCDESC